MERQRRNASKVTDYQKYHLSGDLEQVVQGRVSNTIEYLERTTMSLNLNEETETPEQLQEQIHEQRDSSL